MIINFNNISTIVLDLGGVLLNIKPELSRNAFISLGLDDDSFVARESEKGGVFNLLEKGEISEKHFRESIFKHLKPGTTDLDIDQAWNSMLLDFPRERIELLKRLSKRFNLYLLSNTNAIHCRCFNEQFKKQNGIGLDDLFLKTFYSHKMGARKPNIDIYNKLLSEIAVDASKILFIDDMEVNVKAAQKLGINAVHLDLEKGESILDLFPSI